MNTFLTIICFLLFLRQNWGNYLNLFSSLSSAIIMTEYTGKQYTGLKKKKTQGKILFYKLFITEASLNFSLNCRNSLVALRRMILEVCLFQELWERRKITFIDLKK